MYVCVYARIKKHVHMYTCEPERPFINGCLGKQPCLRETPMLAETTVLPRGALMTSIYSPCRALQKTVLHQQTLL